MGDHLVDSTYSSSHFQEGLLMSTKDSFYKSLTPEENRLAHANEFDLDSPKSIDFDLLYECLRDLKQG